MDLFQAISDGIRAALGVPAAAYALAAVGLNVHFGYTGLLNFGHVGFMLVGAYGTAITAGTYGWPYPAAFLVGVLAAVLLGLLFGLPTLRLRADYLAIVTISIAEMLRLVVRSRTVEGVSGGPQGIQGFADWFYDLNPFSEGRSGIGDITFSSRQLWVMTFGWAMVLLASLLVHLLMRSPWGRVLRAIREDEDAARSLGKPVFTYKLQSLVLGGVFGGLAGILIATDSQYADPELWRAAVTFAIYTVVILGGPGRVLGPIVGAMLFWFVLQTLDTLLRQGITEGSWAGGIIDPTQIGAIRFALVGLALMLLMIFRPQGILGNRQEALVGER